MEESMSLCPGVLSRVGLPSLHLCSGIFGSERSSWQAKGQVTSVLAKRANWGTCTPVFPASSQQAHAWTGTYLPYGGTRGKAVLYFSLLLADNVVPMQWSTEKGPSPAMICTEDLLAECQAELMVGPVSILQWGSQPARPGIAAGDQQPEPSHRVMAH